MATRKCALLLGLAALLVVSALVSGCQPQEAPPPQPPSDSQPAPEPDPEPNLEAIGLLDMMEVDFWDFPQPIDGDQSPQVAWLDSYGPGRAIILAWDEQAQQFKGHLTPRPQEATLLQLALFGGCPLGHDPVASPLPIRSIRQQKGFVTVDLDREAFLAQYGDSAQAGERVLSSLGRTLLSNHRGMEHIGFTMDGGQFVTSYLTLEGDGYGRYDIPPLYSEVSDQEYAALRQSAPYPGLTVDNWPGFNSFANEETASHPQAQAIANLLYLAGDTGAFATPDDIPNRVKVAQALTYLPLATTESIYAEVIPAQPQLAPIAQAVQDMQMTPREWVEEAVRELYGSDAQIFHQSVSGDKWKWHAREGVYTPPHMGGWAGQEPFISRIEQDGDQYLVTFHCIGLRMDGGFSTEDSEDVSPAIWPVDMDDFFRNLDQDPNFLDLIARYPGRQAVVAQQDGRLILKSVSIL